MPSIPSASRAAAAADPDDAALARLRDLVRRGRGLDLAPYKRSYLLRRLAVRQRATGAADLRQYVARVAADPDEIAALLRTLTVNVSEFFRNPTLFALLERRILPERLQACRRDNRPFQAWFAGCASGEEAYSVALLLSRQGLPPAGAQLLGTDLDPEAIAAARAAVYEAPSLREVPAEVRAAWFEPAPAPRALRLRSERLPAVRFRVHDILARPPRRGQDLVFCRNLLIYFDPALHETVQRRLASALRPGGVLALGRVERLTGSVRDLFETIDLRERLYRRLAGA